MAFFEKIPCESAKELMDYLDPNHEFWKMDKVFTRPNWLFRGQGNASWSLIPTAWRGVKCNTNGDIETQIVTIINKYKSNGFFYWILSSNVIDAKTKELIINAYTEVILLFEFAEQCNQQGLYIADYSEIQDLMFNFPDRYHKYLNPEINIEDEAYNRDTMRFWRMDTLAMAQHHGIPTRLLDWTYNGRKAAYFAATFIDEGASHISVYALPSPTFPHPDPKRPHHIRLIEAARYQDTFIRAQEGVFTVDEPGDDFYMEHGEYPSLEKTLVTPLLPGGKSYSDFWAGYKFILPVEEYTDLLDLLHNEKIYHGSLMPTYDNVAKQTLIDTGIYLGS